MTPEDLHSRIDQIHNQFLANLESVTELMSFDETIQTLAISALEKAKRGLKKFNIDNPRFSVDNELRSLKNIRDHSSLQKYYMVMYNQCIVLLVSYFSSSIEELFISSLAWKLSQAAPQDFPNDELKLSLTELITIGSDSAAVAQLVIDKRDISFQDTRSIDRAFTDYFTISIKKNQTVNNIILALACRHAIVHNGAIANMKTIGQIRTAAPRSIKQNMADSEAIQFTLDELQVVIDAMKSYVETLIRALSKL